MFTSFLLSLMWTSGQLPHPGLWHNVMVFMVVFLLFLVLLGVDGPSSDRLSVLVGNSDIGMYPCIGSLFLYITGRCIGCFLWSSEESCCYSFIASLNMLIIRCWQSHSADRRKGRYEGYLPIDDA